MTRMLDDSADDRWTSRLAIGALLLVLLLGAGCQIRVGGTGELGAEADRLRAENLHLHRHVNSLERQLERRVGQIYALEQQLERVAVEIEDADPPVFSEVRFGRFTGGVDSNDNGWHDVVRAYVHTNDQHGRIIPVSGRARLRVSYVGDEDEPALLAERTYEPRDLNRAYRSGVTGTHYTLEVALPDDLTERIGAGDRELTLSLSVLDAATGARHRRSTIITISVPPPPGEAADAEVED